MREEEKGFHSREREREREREPSGAILLTPQDPSEGLNALDVNAFLPGVWRSSQVSIEGEEGG